MLEPPEKLADLKYTNILKLYDHFRSHDSFKLVTWLIYLL